VEEGGKIHISMYVFINNLVKRYLHIYIVFVSLSADNSKKEKNCRQLMHRQIVTVNIRIIITYLNVERKRIYFIF